MDTRIIDFPDVSACYIDDKKDSVWMVLYHNDVEIHLVIDPWEFLQVINTKKIEQIKELLINKIQEK